MRFKYISLTGIIMLTVASVILLPSIFSQLRNPPEFKYYKDHPDLPYTVFSDCKSNPDNVDECYAAYNAAVYLADSADCSPAGKEIKRRFKRLVEHYHSLQNLWGKANEFQGKSEEAVITSSEYYSGG